MNGQKSLLPSRFARRTLLNFEVQGKLSNQIESHGYLPELSDMGSQSNHWNLQQHSEVEHGRQADLYLLQLAVSCFCSVVVITFAFDAKSSRPETGQKHCCIFLKNREKSRHDICSLLNLIRIQYYVGFDIGLKSI